MVDTFTRHSSGSFGWSEVRRLEKRSRRNFPDFGAQSVEHQIAGRPKNTANVRDLKTVALHLQMTNYSHRGVTEFGATIGNDLQCHLILRLGCVNHVSAKTCQTFVGYRRRIDRGG